MIHSLRLLIVCTVGAFLLFGCSSKDKKTPGPSDTVMGSSSGAREDWINETDVAYSEGLVPRDSSRYENTQVGPDGQVIPQAVYASVYFDFDNYGIKQSQRADLGKLAEYLKAHPKDRLIVEGHCDWHGTMEYNLALGDRRANSVKQYLTSLGVEPKRIDTLSRGSLDATRGLSITQGAKDRRADIKLIQKS